MNQEIPHMILPAKKDPISPDIPFEEYLREVQRYKRRFEKQFESYVRQILYVMMPSPSTINLRYFKPHHILMAQYQPAEKGGELTPSIMNPNMSIHDMILFPHIPWNYEGIIYMRDFTWENVWNARNILPIDWSYILKKLVTLLKIKHEEWDVRKIVCRICTDEIDMTWEEIMIRYPKVLFNHLHAISQSPSLDINFVMNYSWLGWYVDELVAHNLQITWEQYFFLRGAPNAKLNEFHVAVHGGMAAKAALGATAFPMHLWRDDLAASAAVCMAIDPDFVVACDKDRKMGWNWDALSVNRRVRPSHIRAFPQAPWHAKRLLFVHDCNLEIYRALEDIGRMPPEGADYMCRSWPGVGFQLLQFKSIQRLPDVLNRVQFASYMMTCKAAQAHEYYNPFMIDCDDMNEVLNKWISMSEKNAGVVDKILDLLAHSAEVLKALRMHLRLIFTYHILARRMREWKRARSQKSGPDCI